MLRTLRCLAFAASTALAAGGALAQPSASVPMRVYAFNSADMTVPRAFLQAGGSGAQWVPAAFYLIQHPKGFVLFDTGVNDREIGRPGSVWSRDAIAYFGLQRSPSQSIEAQLAKAGVKPDDIRYVVISHMHLDHAGNIAKFPKATFVIQNDELKQAWWPDEGFESGYLLEDFQDTRRFNVMRLGGDLDLFGDGALKVMRLPGHTPGSQILVARLPKTGTAVFTGDAVYLEENLDRNLTPGPAGTWFGPSLLRGYQLIRHFRDVDKATLFYAHDGAQFRKYRQPPAFYE
jgi:glyoxylase-like metal-dependent hydrolase (beta-lactamase superfamily II)